MRNSEFLMQAMRADNVGHMRSPARRCALVVCMNALIFASFAHPFRLANAQGFVTATPAVVDIRASARDIVNQEIVLTNTSGGKIKIYPVVRNVDPSSGRQAFPDPSEADLSSSLANWIYLSRGAVELEPGETRAVPFEIRVNLTARPGRYHAMLYFPEGYARHAAEGNIAIAPSVAVNVEVADDARDILALRRFAPLAQVFWRGTAAFLYELENTGDRPETPRGEVIIYDRSGREIASVPLSGERETLGVGETKAFRVAWDGTANSSASASMGLRGRYKAQLALHYGVRERGFLQDTTFFWLVPWFELLLFLALLLSVCGGLAFVAHRRYDAWMRARHGGALPREDRREPEVGSEHVVDLRKFIDTQ